MNTKSIGQRSLSCAGPTQWNSLSYKVRHAESASAFNAALKSPSLQVLLFLTSPLPRPGLLRFTHKRQPVLIHWLEIACVLTRPERLLLLSVDHE